MQKRRSRFPPSHAFCHNNRSSSNRIMTPTSQGVASMLVPAGASKTSSRISGIWALTAILVLLLTPVQAQKAAPNTGPTTSQQGSVPQKANPATEVGKAVGSRPVEAPQTLQQ